MRTILMIIIALLLVSPLTFIISLRMDGSSQGACELSERTLSSVGAVETVRFGDRRFDYDSFGGSWLDEFTDEGGVSWHRNVTFADGDVNLTRFELSNRNCVGHWKFDEGSGNTLHDSSGNGNDGTLQNMGAGSWVDGISGKALEFDGANDRVWVPDSNSLSVERGDFSVEVWVNTTQVHSDDNGMVILDKYPQGSRPWFIRLRKDGHVQFRCDGSVQSGEVVNDGTWHHLLGLRRGQVIELYVDGALSGRAASNTMNDNPVALTMGATSMNTRYFEGKIDEVCIYPRALSAADVGQHFRRDGFSRKGVVSSVPIEKPGDEIWDLLSVNKEEEIDSYVNVSVIDAATNTTVDGFDNLSGSSIDLAALNELGFGSIILRAYFEGNGNHTAFLNSWGVEWRAENAWRDSFAGDGKTNRSLSADGDTVALWHFDEGTGNDLGDSGSNNNHGVLHNFQHDEGSGWAEGRIGGCLRFDGVDDHVEIPFDNSLQLDADDFTVEAWIRTSSAETQRIFCNYDDSNFVDYFFMDVFEGRARARIEYDHSALSTARVDDGMWHHIASVRRGDDLYIYVDGILEGRCPGVDDANAGNSGGSYSIGKQLVGLSFPFQGYIDELRISDKARTGSEIYGNAHMDVNLSGGSLGLREIREENNITIRPEMLGFWDFNEGSGDDVGDSTGGGNDGTRKNMEEGDWVDGRFGKALRFDGIDEHVELPQGDNILGITRDFTIAGVITPMDMPSSSMIILDLNYASVTGNKGNGICICTYPDRKLGCFVYLADDNDGTSYSLSSNTLMTAGNTYFFVFTRDDTRLHLYMDDVRESTVQCSGNDVQFSYDYPNHLGDYNNLAIFRHHNGNLHSPFNGIIDEMAVYHRVFSPVDIHGVKEYIWPNATIRSDPISLPPNMTWDKVAVNRTVPENTYLNVSVHDSETHEILAEDTNQSDRVLFNISALNPDEHGSIYLKARLQSNETMTPAIFDWAVNWTSTDIQSSPPLLIDNISDVELTEDNPEEGLVDLSEHFLDPHDDIASPDFFLDRVSDPDNITIIVNGTLLDVVYLARDWYGNVSVVAGCRNVYHHIALSNEFLIRVINVNDAPVWTSLPRDISMDEDTCALSDYSLDDHIVDADGDMINFTLVSDEKHIVANLSNSNHIRINATGNYWGEANITVEATDRYGGNSTPATISVMVESVNDRPLSELVYPANNTVLTESNVTLSWKGFDVDHDPENMLYDLYIGEEPSSLDMFYSDIEGDNITVQDLADGLTYYWTVIPYDRTDYGGCLNGTWHFTVNTTHPVPEVTLTSPQGIVNETDVTLRWTVENPTEEPVSFHVLLGDSPEELDFIIETRETSFPLSGLEEGATYYWTIIPYAGSIKGICASGIGTFTVNSSFVALYSIEMEADPDRLTLVQGESEILNINVTNTGNVEFIIEPQVTGDLSSHAIVNDSITLSPGGTVVLPVTITIPDDLAPNVYLLTITGAYPGGSGEIGISVTVREAKEPILKEQPDDKSLFAQWWFWLLVVVIVLVLLGGGILVLVLSNRRKDSSSVGLPAPTDLEVEVEHVPEGGFSRESEIDIIARGLAPPSQVNGTDDTFSSFPGDAALIQAPSPPQYMLPGESGAFGQLPHSTAPQEMMALPQASAVTPRPTQAYALSSPVIPGEVAALPPASPTEPGTVAALPPASPEHPGIMATTKQAPTAYPPETASLLPQPEIYSGAMGIYPRDPPLALPGDGQTQFPGAELPPGNVQPPSPTPVASAAPTTVEEVPLVISRPVSLYATPDSQYGIPPDQYTAQTDTAAPPVSTQTGTDGPALVKPAAVQIDGATGVIPAAPSPSQGLPPEAQPLPSIVDELFPGFGDGGDSVDKIFTRPGSSAQQATDSTSSPPPPTPPPPV